MDAGVVPEVDEGHRLGDDPTGGVLDDAEGTAERHNRAVVLAIGVDIENSATTGTSHLFDGGPVPPLTDVDDTFDQCVAVGHVRRGRSKGQTETAWLVRRRRSIRRRSRSDFPPQTP
jgi:hypothetical protein